MNLGTKIGLAGVAVGITMQTVGGLLMVREYEKLRGDYKKVWESGQYLISILERENVELTEFDRIAYKTILESPKPKKKKS